MAAPVFMDIFSAEGDHLGTVEQVGDDGDGDENGEKRSIHMRIHHLLSPKYY